MNEWNWLDTPTKIGEIDQQWRKDPTNRPPWGVRDVGLLLLVEDRGRQSVILIGDETDLWYTAGCGCCSEVNEFTVLAWRVALEQSAWEVPTR